MNLSRRVMAKLQRPVIWLAVGVASVFLFVSTWLDSGGTADFGALALDLVILFITATTLHLAIPDPARIWLDRQGELGIDDLIFYVEGDSAEGLPRDVLLQLHVAVSNVGGRKAVLSMLELVAFLDSRKHQVEMGLVPVRAMGYSTRHHWVDKTAVLRGQQNDLERFTIREEDPGPFVLAPDDVITLRLSARGGIDWTDQWNLKALQSRALALEQSIQYARLIATFCRVDELVTQSFDIPITVLQQPMYVEALRFVTNDFTTRPEVDYRPVLDF